MSAPAPPPQPADPVRGLVAGAAAVVLLLGLWWASDVLAPALLAVVFATTAYPLQRLLVRRGWHRVLAFLATLAVVYAILLTALLLVVVSIIELVETLPNYDDKIQDLVNSWSNALGGPSASSALSDISGTSIANAVLDVVHGVTGALATGIILVGVIFFLLLDSIGMPARYARFVDDRPWVAESWSAWSAQTRRYIGIATLFGLVVAVIDTLLLWALDVPLPIVWGLLAFVTNYIPNIGFIIGVVPPALLGLLDGGAATMIWVIVGYSVVNFTIQMVIQPKVVADAVSIAATVSFLSVFFWVLVVGPLGAILCIPLTLFVQQVVLRPYAHTRWSASLIGSG
ncbi:MAG: AI-2E family transporter [Candidatus Nanopelagicales bacterium]